MSREIKFRAWEGRRMLFMGKEGYNDFEIAGGEIFMLSEFEAHKKDWPLMQYTSLKDKNGVDIYEGDIVEDSIMGGLVRYNPELAGYEPFVYCGGAEVDAEDCEVIGNEYE